ncbi:glycosyltransferase family 39 protein [Pseudoroseomonas globiformis]|uniref:Glycosyltransferase family 39 protein n=1 Tax=Teichococcus globiformis TaxID=2307229 RepID=A0ABV7G6H0_9PROT
MAGALMKNACFWIAALLIMTGVRIIVAAELPLAPDEAYYWIWSKALAPSYYDHPPMVALWISAGTSLAGDTQLGVRLLAPIGVAIASFAIAGAASLLFPGKDAGPWAAAFMNATLLFAAGSVLMTPDTPLLVFWCLAVWALAKVHVTADGRWWLVFGAITGCAILSKYTAVFLGLGALVWLAASPTERRWFRDWRLWAGGVIALLFSGPVILWNATHDWVSFAKQGGRTADSEASFSLRFLGELVGGQIGLVTPIIFMLCVLGMVVALRRWRVVDASAERLLVSMTVPAAAIFLWQATGSRVQGNWPAILYPAACIAAAALLQQRWLAWRRPAAGLGLAATLMVMLQAVAAPLPLPRSSDPTLARLGGWNEFVAKLEAIREERGLAFVAAEEYGLASEMRFYSPPVTSIVAVGDRWSLFDLPATPSSGQGLLVRSIRRGETPPLWPGAQPVGEVSRVRGGIEAERYRLYVVNLEVAAPPRVLLPKDTT